MTNTPPPLFSKREKYSLAMFSVAFIAFSAAVHMMAGGMGYGLLPHFTVEPTPSPQIIILIPRAIHTPKPTPTPHPTPTPPPPKVTPQRVPAVHPPTNAASPEITTGPVEPPCSPPPTPAVDTSSEPPATPSAAPVASATPGGPVAIQESTFRFKASFEYPQFEIEAGNEGTVVILVTIGPDGNLLSASVASSSGHADFDEAALKAARTSRYTPYYVDGNAVEQQYTIVYEFRLDRLEYR